MVILVVYKNINILVIYQNIENSSNLLEYQYSSNLLEYQYSGTFSWKLNAKKISKHLIKYWSPQNLRYDDTALK